MSRNPTLEPKLANVNMELNVAKIHHNYVKTLEGSHLWHLFTDETRTTRKDSTNTCVNFVRFLWVKWTADSLCGNNFDEILNQCKRVKTLRSPVKVILIMRKVHMPCSCTIWRVKKTFIFLHEKSPRKLLQTRSIRVISKRLPQIPKYEYLCSPFEPSLNQHTPFIKFIPPEHQSLTSFFVNLSVFHSWKKTLDRRQNQQEKAVKQTRNVTWECVEAWSKMFKRRNAAFYL